MPGKGVGPCLTSGDMPTSHVVVDGSNIATEGRSLPSLAQLDEAVRAYLDDHPDATITVVVDATFGHRIDDSERQLFEEARAAGELISPPAGAVGRGDAFVLRIAEKAGARVLSNDSFQEFHGEHEWLFDKDRLFGGVPVAGVGWIFTPRTPVRGPESREATRTARRQKGRERPVSKVVQKAIEVATEEVVGGDRDGERRGRRRRGAAPPSEPVNEPLPFIQFIAEHRLGTEVQGEVESFSSHGAFVKVGDLQAYIPISAMGDPPPRAAREALTRGETRAFVVQALDPAGAASSSRCRGTCTWPAIRPTRPSRPRSSTASRPRRPARPRPRRQPKPRRRRKPAPPRGCPTIRTTAARTPSRRCLWLRRWRRSRCPQGRCTRIGAGAGRDACQGLARGKKAAAAEVAVAEIPEKAVRKAKVAVEKAPIEAKTEKAAKKAAATKTPAKKTAKTATKSAPTKKAPADEGPGREEPRAKKAPATKAPSRPRHRPRRRRRGQGRREEGRPSRRRPGRQGPCQGAGRRSPRPPSRQKAPRR